MHVLSTSLQKPWRRRSPSIQSPSTHSSSSPSLLDGTSCPACLGEYHTHFRVQCHLRNAKTCRAILLRREPVPQPAPGAGSQVNRQLACRHDGLLPPQKGAGPLQPSRVFNVDEDFDQHLYSSILEMLLDWDNTTCLKTSLQTCIKQCATSWTSCRRTLRYLEHNVNRGDGDQLGITDDELKHAFRHLQLATSWPFLCEEQNPEEIALSTWDLHSLESWCTHMHHSTSVSWKRKTHIPRDFCHVRIILHVFAGRRRRGDFQWYLDAMAKRYPFPTWVVSLVVIIDAKHGNLADADVRKYWYTAMLERKICGILCGPPCETWSVARTHTLAPQPGHQARGPRPLRGGDINRGDYRP